jgi:hypothetical protein
VEFVAVELDGQTLLAPHGVDLEPGDVGIGLGEREIGGAQERGERLLEV